MKSLNLSMKSQLGLDPKFSTGQYKILLADVTTPVLPTAGIVSNSFVGAAGKFSPAVASSMELVIAANPINFATTSLLIAARVILSVGAGGILIYLTGGTASFTLSLSPGIALNPNLMLLPEFSIDQVSSFVTPALSATEHTVAFSWDKESKEMYLWFDGFKKPNYSKLAIVDATPQAMTALGITNNGTTVSTRDIHLVTFENSALPDMEEMNNFISFYEANPLSKYPYWKS
jgi:hypothetical protein